MRGLRRTLKVQRKALVQQRGIFGQAFSRVRFAVPESRHVRANRSGTDDVVRWLLQTATANGQYMLKATTDARLC